MKINKYLFVFLLLASFWTSFAQKSKIYTNDLVEYNRAVELYKNKNYRAAQTLFRKIWGQFDDGSELKARCYYYNAFSAIRLAQNDADQLMKDFFEKYPTSTKRNTAYLEVGDYYFNNGRYAYALKWFSKVDESTLNNFNNEEFAFKNGYSLYAVGSYARSKTYFSRLLNSPTYGSQAKYYYGYMAYKDDDFDSADKYLSQVENENDDIPYYLANIKFKTGKFQEAIDTATPLLKKSRGLQHSEISKIIGESYFNLNDYDNAVNYLLDYKGKKGKWNNTDYYQLGYAYYMQKDYENAMLWFTKIIDGNNSVSQNAYYHLAECYLKSDKKQEALNAFRNAKQMNFDLAIKKDAWLNYAKLSYEIGNPYKSASKIIQEYLIAYPDNADSKEINDLLISAFITSSNYEEAIKYLSENKKSKTNENYQKVTYLYGIQLFNSDQYEKAINNFNLSLSSTPDLNYKAKATFWKAESNYRLANYKKALNGFKNFKNLPEASKVSESKIIDYNTAYTYFKLKDYSNAGGSFNLFAESNPSNKEQLIDSYVRLGDCYYALSDYYKAIKPYQKVVDANNIDTDYAQFQMAMCYGFMGEMDNKIKTLQDFTQYNLKSTLRDDAYYELGNSYVKKNQITKALKAYDDVIKNYKMSSLVPKSLLKQGLIYYNNDKNNEALNKYKTIVKNYPGTAEAKEGIANAKQIYIDLGRVDEYEKFIKGIDYVSISDDDLDNTMYQSAEQLYLKNDYKKAIVAFQKYLTRFPNGSNVLPSNFYLAETYNNQKQIKKSVPHYSFITAQERNQYTERSLVQLAYYYLKKEDWENGIKILKKLELQADSDKNITFAQSNLMKGNYALKNYEKAVEYAEIVLQKNKLESKIKSDAQIIIARSAFETNDFYKAQDAFKIVEESAIGELKAEAIYYDAYFKNKDGNYKLSNVATQKLASDFSSYEYWAGKGLIIMAKNFYELKDAYQATYILESVINKFSNYSDIVGEARSELNKIKSKEAKTNSSVIIGG
ncbi:MAG: tetratricopeptide repeat protein [Flavobacteriaceae bacterium]|nr:tetratricopeptide repeat protein [Flavobacteriaceae bacterium]